MSFPENALIDGLYWLINTPGLGGIAVVLLGGGIVITVSLILFWIARPGADAEQEDTYAYPTTALHHKDHAEDSE